MMCPDGELVAALGADLVVQSGGLDGEKVTRSRLPRDSHLRATTPLANSSPSLHLFLETNVTCSEGLQKTGSASPLSPGLCSPLSQEQWC